MAKKTYKKQVFQSKRLNTEVTFSEAQQRAFERLERKNFHTEVRLALAELFHAPKYLKNAFRALLTIQHACNGIEYKDFQSRNAYTTKLNNFIKRNYGVKAYNFAVSVQ